VTEIRQHRRYEATVRFRRDGQYQTTPIADLVEGRRIKFYCGWPFEEGEQPLYQGEFAMIPDPVYAEPGVGWIASGDLVDIRPLTGMGLEL
jgi:hypothetical protein